MKTEAEATEKILRLGNLCLSYQAVIDDCQQIGLSINGMVSKRLDCLYREIAELRADFNRLYRKEHRRIEKRVEFNKPV